MSFIFFFVIWFCFGVNGNGLLQHTSDQSVVHHMCVFIYFFLHKNQTITEEAKKKALAKDLYE